MKDKQDKIDRRHFLKTMGAAGLAPAFAGVTKAEPNVPAKTQKTKYPQVPRRKLGKTGVKVSSLALGTIFDLVENQTVLRMSLRWGVNYWDTANNYVGGQSELGIGKFFAKNPKARKKVFLCTKASGAKTVAEVEERLQTSLKRMKTDYIDLYYGVHVMSNPARLTDELKQWAEKAKKRGVIRFFGFSSHSNMAECLAAAPKLGWIDAVLATYNFRVMQDKKLQAAVEACHKAGIGLTAMKTQGKPIKSEGDKKLTDHFLQRGFTEAQAKIKVALEDKRFSSVAVRMENIALLTSNVAAVLDKTKLTQADKDVFKQYAAETCNGYCAGCSNICNAALPNIPYVSEVMRYLMYYNSYGDTDRAKELFAKIPAQVRGKLLSTDYRATEARCPQHLPIGKLVTEAVNKLA
ncbi:MAG: aldo/keto reductase [Planctomycetota bacterium]|jgi:predicted aldo/keto reductase-like oxidoreductase